MATATIPSPTEAHDTFPINGTDYIEFYVGNAKQSSLFYQHVLGFQLVAYRGPETGVRWLMDDRVGVDPAATAHGRPLQLLREADRALLARVEDPTGAGGTTLHDELMTLRRIPVGRGQRFELGSRQRLRGRLAHVFRGC